MNEDTMDESTDFVNQQTENEKSRLMELADTNEEQKEQNLPDPEIDKNVEQGREIQGSENIPAIAALLLQNSSANKSKLEVSEFSNKKDILETCPKILTEKALCSDIENQRRENEISSPMELPDTKIEELKEQNHPDPGIEENVEQGRERQGSENIPAIAILLLQNSSGNKSILNESEFSGKNNSDKNDSIETGPKILSKALTIDIENQQTENEISTTMELSDTKIEDQKEQNLPDPEIEENVEQGRERQGSENIPAIATLLLQNSSGNKSILNESEFSGKNNSDKNDTIETCPKILSKALTIDIENQQTENEISTTMELSDTKIEDQKEQNLPDPEIEENVEQGRERQGSENIPAIATLLLQNSSGNKSILNESEFSGKNNSDKNDSIETCPKILSKALTIDIENQQTENEISTTMELSDTKIEDQKEQNLPDPEIEENVEQGRERQGLENIPAIAAFLLQNSSGNKIKLKENDIENQQTENEMSTTMELSHTKIEEQKEQNVPDPEIKENVEQGRERQGSENIPAIAALLLQNSSGNKLKLKESEFSGKNNSNKKDTTETFPKIETEKALSSEIDNQQTENEIASRIELSDTNIEEQKEQNLPDPEIEENVEQGRERQGCEDIPAIAALLLQNSIVNKSKLKESEFSGKNISDKNNTETGPKILSKVSTNGLPIMVIDQDEGKETMKGSPLPDSELENSNSCQEKILSNSKDSSMLSTTDTQDEIETIDNGDQIYINHLDDQAEIAAQSNLAKQQLLAMSNSDDSSDGMLGDDFDHHTEETFSIVSGSEYDEASQGSIQEKQFENPAQDIDKPMEENGNEEPKLIEIEIETKNNKEEDINGSLSNDKNKTGQTKKNGNSVKPELRRSSRTVKQRKYSYDEQNDDEYSEIDESDTEDTQKRKSRPIIINDTKSLVEIAARQAARSTASDRRKPQLVLIGSKPKQATSAPTPKNTSSSLHSSLYQSIVARGTTVTPVPSKPVATTTSQAVQTSPTPTPVLLPSLTDDMFVVEAPSFIVPYVYEKPSVKPFKEFVTELGKNIEKQRAKAEKELLEKKMEEKLKRQERIYQGEEVTDSEEGAKRKADEKKIGKKEKRQHGQEEDESSWDGWDSSDSDDFKITDDSGTTMGMECKDELGDNIKKSVPASPSNSNSYFDGTLGKFFTNIGTGLVEEYVQRDLLKAQQRKLQREKKAGHSTIQRELVKSISLLTKNYEISKLNNKPLKCVEIKCEYCTFKTESEIVLAQHMETPHMKNNMYKCNFCEFEIRSPHDILFHMEAEHNVRGRLERAPAYHQCVNCPFEDNGKGKLARHVIACAKKFKPAYNLSPPADWEPPAKIPKVAKGRQTMLGAPIPLSGPFGRPQPSMNPFNNMLPTTSTSSYRPRARVPGPIMTRPVIAGGSIVRGSSIQQQNAAAAQAAAIAKKNHPSISITPVPPRPVLPALPPHESATATFVICEICDGYIKDLEQLRNHMQWIHRVKIHPKMIYNRPPLNCQKCQFRFFTDMGLERHLLGSHGLVTSSMQDAANKNKDAGRCPVCGKVFQWKLLNHMAKDHGMTLKPAHLSYKCTVCTATFEMYKLFENHVYSAHSVVAKRVMDKVPVKEKINNLPKGLKINDEITITAQPARPKEK